MDQTVIRQPHNFLIHARDLTWGYPNTPKTIFHKLNFAFYKNEFCILTGKSGSGKSSLAKLIMGEYRLPNRMLYHKNEDLARFSDEEIQIYRRKIGMVYQDYKLIHWKTVIENIAYPLDIIGAPQMHKDLKLEKVLKLLGIYNLKDVVVQYLSGGEKQKVSIARALVHNPEFIIADEPTGNLDWQESQKIADILIQLNQMGNSILLITHDMSLKAYIEKKQVVSTFTL